MRTVIISFCAQIAESFYQKANSPLEAVNMYNMACKWEEAYRVCHNFFQDIIFYCIQDVASLATAALRFTMMHNFTLVFFQLSSLKI